MSNTDTHPLVAVIEQLVADTNVMWSTGTVAADSTIADVEPDLVAVQYAPHYDGGVWRASSAADWVDGTAAAGAALAGEGCRWEMTGLQVLERTGDEALASYRITHHWGSPDRRPAEAFFLETWRRGEDGRWRLARHTAEKV